MVFDMTVYVTFPIFTMSILFYIWIATSMYDQMIKLIYQTRSSAMIDFSSQQRYKIAFVSDFVLFIN